MISGFGLVLICGALFGRGGSQGENAIAAGTQGKYSIMIPLWNPESPTPDVPAWQELEKLAGVSLDIQFVPSDSYNDKLNVSIAAGELPHSFVVLDNKGNSFVSAAKGGMFWEVTDTIKNSQNLSKNLDPKVLENAAIDGKNYYIPRTRVTVRNAYEYRKDWLEKLNLKAPETLDELYNVIKAFTTRDPDGNGRNDTYGLIIWATDTGFGGLDITAITNGAGNGWIVENSQIVPVFATRPYIDMLRFFKRLYDEKLINQDFATITQQKGFELLNAEQGGMFIQNSDEIMNRFDPLVSAKQARNPDTKLEDLWDFTYTVKSPDGSIRLPGGIGFYGGFVFPKTALKNQPDFQAVFNIFDKIDSDVGKNLLQWGIEGRNYELRNGKAFQINLTNYVREVSALAQLRITGSSQSGSLQGERQPLQEKVDATQLASAQYAVMDPTYPFISQTQTTRGAELQKIISDAKIQFVMGQINEAGYLTAIERWKTSGGQLIINEFTNAWKASN
jgi:putative aldouronate transport system substrate-binding protein